MAKIFRNETLDEAALAKLSLDEKDWIYNALDCTVTFEVHDRQLEDIDDVALNTLRFSEALVAPVLEANLRGTLVDEAERQRVLKLFRGQRAALEAGFLRVLYEGIGLLPPFNYRSHPQVKFLFYKVMGIKPVLKRNNEGIWVPSADREALEKVAEYFPARLLCIWILLLRDLDKKIQFLESEVDDDGCIRTSFNIAGTNTGRLSSSHSDEGTGTNQQNIERALRRVYVPFPGYKFCNIDLEQGDARNVGAIIWELFVDSHGEEWAGRYLDACESGDLHTNVARMCWPELAWPGTKDGDRAVADQLFYRTLTRRDSSKKLGHGTNYYGTPRTMSQKTKIEESVVRDFQIKYFAGFPMIGAVKFNDKGYLIHDLTKDNWHSWVSRQLSGPGAPGYLITPFYNRRRYFFGRGEDDSTLREAIAYSPQSMTADAIDTAWLALWRWGKVIITIQDHDSLLIQYPADREEEMIPEILKRARITHRMRKGREFVVPPEAKIGWNWADAGKDNPNGLIKWKPGLVDDRPRPLLAPTRSEMKAILAGLAHGR